MEITTKDEKLLIMLNASAFKDSSCIKRLFYNTIKGYRSKINDNVIEFGTAFHKFRAIVRSKGQDALHEALNSARDYYTKTPMRVSKKKAYLTKEFLWSICMNYNLKYLNDPFKPHKIGDTSMIELPFTFPYYVDEHMEILMSGTIDEIGYFKSGVSAICDCKTSGVWEIEKYFKGYNLSPQLLFYRWAAIKYQEAFPDKWPKEIDTDCLCCFIDGIFYMGAELDKVSYERSGAKLYTNRDIKTLEVLIETKVAELIASVRSYQETGEIPIREGMLNGACQTVYGECKFFNACSAPDEETESIILEQQFIKTQYNPLQFHE